MAPCPHRFEARRAAAVSLLRWLAVWLAASITFYARFA